MPLSVPLFGLAAPFFACLKRKSILFAKRLNELNRMDIQKIIDDEIPEGSEVEYKKTLPTKDGKPDRWLSDQKEVGEKARNEILAELIAFANAYGGTLILGIDETDDHPKRAAAIVPLPNCADLANRFRSMCRDSIDPQIPLIDINEVVTEKDGAGVVVFRVPKSRMAPHRHNATREFYIRRADRTEKMMSMREIQDLTLQVSRGLESIERKFDARRELFQSRFQQFHAKASSAKCESFGIRLTLIPLTPLYVAKVHNNTAIQPPLSRFTLSTNQSQQYDVDVPIHSVTWRPILRGSSGRTEEGDLLVEREVHCDGEMEYTLCYRIEPQMEAHSPRSLTLYPEWFMCLVVNALCSAENFRNAAGAPEVEYGLDIEIRHQGGGLSVAPYGTYSYVTRNLGPIAPGSSPFPRYSVGNPQEFEAIINLIHEDFWNIVGHLGFPCNIVDFPYGTKGS